MPSWPAGSWGGAIADYVGWVQETFLDDNDCEDRARRKKIARACDILECMIVAAAAQANLAKAHAELRTKESLPPSTPCPALYEHGGSPGTPNANDALGTSFNTATQSNARAK